MSRGDVVLGLAVRSELLHGVWMKDGTRIHTETAPVGIRSIADAARELLSKGHPAPAEAVLAVPFQRIFMRSIDLPPVPDLPLGPFAEQFASTELPYSIAEAILDYCVTESEKGRRLFLTAGTKKDYEPYRAALETIDIPARRAVPLTLAAFKAADVPATVPNYLLIYFWNTYIDHLWCSDGRPRHLRHVPMQRARLMAGVTSKDPEVLAVLTSELRVSAEFVRKNSGADIRSIMACVVSTDSRLDELPALLQPDVPFTIQGKLLEGPEGTMLAAGSCSIAESANPDLNFFAPKKSNPLFSSGPAFAPARRQKLLVQALAVALLIVTLSIVKTLISYTWVKNTETDRQSRPVSEQSLPAGAATQLHSFLTSPDATDVLDPLSRAIPPETNLQDVTIDEAMISIRGTAPKAVAVYQGMNGAGFQNVKFLQDVVAAEEPGLEAFALSAEPAVAAFQPSEAAP